MANDNIISRSDASALIPEEVSSEIIANLNNESAALTMFRRVTMSTSQIRMPVLAALPFAYWVNGDTGLKSTTEVNWENKFLNVEELAAIVPIPEAVLEDTSYDVWGNVRPLLEEAIGIAVDQAVLFGINKPASWPNSIATAAAAAPVGNTFVRGTHTAAEGGIAEDINGLFSTVEDDGFDVTGAVAHRKYRGFLRGARDAEGRRLDDVSPTEAYGVAISYPARGQWPTGPSAVEMIAGDFTQGILGVRQDITYKVLDQAVITDPTGAIKFNLPQQDMVALRVVFRCAFEVSNGITYDQPDKTKRYPFATMLAPVA